MRWPAVAIGIAITVGAASASPLGALLPLPFRHDGTPALADVTAPPPDDLQIAEPGYILDADPATAVVSVLSPTGRPYTSFPLTMLAGSGAIPTGDRRRLVRDGQTFVASILSPSGAGQETVILDASATSFTVRFSALPGPDPALTPQFFYDGSRGIDLTAVTSGFTPDTDQPAGSPHPAIDTGVRTALAPPPLDVELSTAAGWLGVGLVQVPDATSLEIDPSGAVDVDYPLAVLATIPDDGGGGMVGSMLQFPDFVVTFATDAIAGLRAYDRALAALGAAPSTPERQQSWWEEPLVDTWGEQVAEDALRGSPQYTAGWVQAFVDQWRARFGVRTFTVVIDSQWQAEIGSAEPDPARFGGVAGMRTLIDDLHAQGLHVLLWWPIWEVGISTVPPTPQQLRSQDPDHVVDPTAPGFVDSMTATVQRLLGSGPGDLDADGLKLDWEYDIPSTFADPEEGVGDAALFRYLQVIDDAAHVAKPGALVDSSAAAPQFASVTDAVRLYDAWSEADWQTRATIVSAADPGVLIDGDGWDVTPADAVTHAVASTVWGAPATYFATRWAGGAPLLEPLARTLGAIVGLSTLKGAGEPEPIAGGEWRSTLDGQIRAQTFGGQTGLVVWQPQSCRQPTTGYAVSATGGREVIPLPRAGGVRATDPGGQALRLRRVGDGVAASLDAGTVYTLRLAAPGC